MGVSGCSVIHMYFWLGFITERNAIAKSTFLWPGTAAIFTFLAKKIINFSLFPSDALFVVFQPISEGHFRLDFRLFRRNGKNRQFLLQTPFFRQIWRNPLEKTPYRLFLAKFEARRAPKTGTHRFLTSAGQKSGLGCQKFGGSRGSPRRPLRRP